MDAVRRQRVLTGTAGFAGLWCACWLVAGCDIVVEPPFCGGIAGVPCPVGQFCEFEAGVCGRGDQSGLCAEIPGACIEPVS